MKHTNKSIEPIATTERISPIKLIESGTLQLANKKNNNKVLH
jgi:hypothetical protein